MNLEKLGWDSYFEHQFKPYQEKGFMQGRIVSKQNNHYLIQDGIISIQAKVTGRFRYHSNVASDFPSVGDWVVYEVRVNSDFAFIHAVLPRKSYFSRKLPISGGRKIKRGIIDGGSTEEQVIAANIDLVFIISGLDGDFDIRRIERYLTLTFNSGANPVIVLNKIDLCDNLEEKVTQVQKVAHKVSICTISAEKNINMEELTKYLTPGKTVALLGSSGVGKSTITNFLLDEERQRMQTTSIATGKGRHTTTAAELFVHPAGFMIIDTPGLRELQLWGDEQVLEDSFGDITNLITQCSFTDCQHQSEPGCAIKQAIQEGRISDNRFESYQKQADELHRVNSKKTRLEIQMNKRFKERKRSGL